jgi:hypothetical protein
MSMQEINHQGDMIKWGLGFNSKPGPPQPGGLRGKHDSGGVAGSQGSV